MPLVLLAEYMLSARVADPWLVWLPVLVTLAYCTWNGIERGEKDASGGKNDGDDDRYNYFRAKHVVWWSLVHVFVVVAVHLMCGAIKAGIKSHVTPAPVMIMADQVGVIGPLPDNEPTDEQGDNTAGIEDKGGSRQRRVTQIGQWLQTKRKERKERAATKTQKSSKTKAAKKSFLSRRYASVAGEEDSTWAVIELDEDKDDGGGHYVEAEEESANDETSDLWENVSENVQAMTLIDYSSDDLI